MTQKYHWLVAGNVVAVTGKGAVGQKGFNTLVSTEEPRFNRDDLARAQDGLMQRFVAETPLTKDDKIVDVFIISISNLGLMTQEEFNGSFVAPAPVAN